MFGTVTAQQHFFLYIQTENKQPFYVKTNEKLYSSSATGYVVISKLSPDIHVLTIGFNKEKFPEQNFRLVVDKDAGYLLKDYGTKGWGLVNLQNNLVVMNGAQKAEPESDDDPFSKTLSQVVNTPDLKTENKKETVVVEKPVVINKEVITEDKPVMAIRLLLNDSDAKGRQMVYQDGKDTIRLFIENNAFSNEKKETVVIKAEPEKEIKKEENVIPVKEMVKEEKGTVPETRSELKMINSDCKLFATQDEFLKLRKKMAAESSDDGMIDVAKKEFKKRCYATEQIRNLSVLFLKDDGKYKFLDVAYPFVHDSSNFNTLENILSDVYYKNRFQAMIRR